MDNDNLQYVFGVLEYFDDDEFGNEIEYYEYLPHHKEIKKFLEDSFKKFVQRADFNYGVDFYIPGDSLELKVIQDEVTGEEKGVITWHLKEVDVDGDVFEYWKMKFEERMYFLLDNSGFKDTFAYQVSDRKIPGVDKHYFLILV